MSFDPDFQLENFEELFGDIEQVHKVLNECPVCGSKMVHTHLSDYKNLYIHENSRCTDCGHGNRKKIHHLN